MVLRRPCLLPSGYFLAGDGATMKSLRTIAVVALLGVGLGSTGSPVAASQTFEALLLENHQQSLPVDEEVQMWECWEDKPGNSPRLLQRVGKRWVALDTADVYRDANTCGKQTPIRADYTFTLEDSLRWNKKKKSYEAIVRTVCSTCVTYNWTILVDQ